MKRYFKYIRPYLLYFIIGPILMITEVIGEVFMPKLMSMIINTGIINSDYAFIIKIGFIMIVMAIAMMAGGIGGNYFAAKASINFAADLRSDVFGKVQKFSFKNIDKFSTGSLITRLTNDITQVQDILRMSLVIMLRAPGMLIGGLIMAISIKAELAVVIVVVIPVLIVTIIVLIKFGFQRFTTMQKKLDNLNSSIQENLTNIRVVKSFVRTKYEEKKFGAGNEDLKKSTIDAMNIMIIAMPVMTVAMNISTIAVVWFGGRFVINGLMPVGDLSAFTIYIVQILMALVFLSMIIMRSSRSFASIKRINEVLDTKIDLVDDAAKYKNKVVTSGRVEFKNVSFKYNEDGITNTLENITFAVNPGEMLGIIGATGCGKTSLVQLIPRLYDVTDGQVLVDGVDVRDYSLENIREGVGMVLQNNILFSGTIMENLIWGNEKATDDEIFLSASHAQANDFVNGFSSGYETELGQGGVNLSGGQKQRLCIARALLKKPKILILDDSTSAVDTATETNIRESFTNDLKNMTKIIIAQRITSVMDADKIIVLDNGKIVGVGKHEELIKNNVEYQEIYYSQRDREVSA